MAARSSFLTALGAVAAAGALTRTAAAQIRTPFSTGPLTPAVVQPVLTAGYNAKIFDHPLDAATLIAKI